MKKAKFIEVAVKVIVAALTAFLTAITTTSCMGHGPITLCQPSPSLLKKKPKDLVLSAFLITFVANLLIITYLLCQLRYSVLTTRWISNCC